MSMLCLLWLPCVSWKWSCLHTSSSNTCESRCRSPICWLSSNLPKVLYCLLVESINWAHYSKLLFKLMSRTSLIFKSFNPRLVCWSTDRPHLRKSSIWLEVLLIKLIWSSKQASLSKWILRSLVSNLCLGWWRPQRSSNTLQHDPMLSMSI